MCLQVPLGDLDAMSGPSAAGMIYPRGKKWLITFTREQAAFRPLAELVRARGFMGGRLFCYAKKLDDFSIEVQLEELPAQEQPW